MYSSSYSTAIVPYQFSTVPEEIITLVIQHLKMKDLSVFTTICTRFHKIAMRDNSALLGYQKWPYEKEFKQMKRIDQNSVELYFECENFSKLKHHVLIFFQIISRLFPKGVLGEFEVHGKGKQTLGNLPCKTAVSKTIDGSAKEYLKKTAYNWDIHYRWHTNYYNDSKLNTKFKMIGVVKKAIQEPLHHYDINSGYYFHDQALSAFHHNVPQKQMDKLQTIIVPLFFHTLDH